MTCGSWPQIRRSIEIETTSKSKTELEKVQKLHLEPLAREVTEEFRLFIMWKSTVSLISTQNLAVLPNFCFNCFSISLNLLQDYPSYLAQHGGRCVPVWGPLTSLHCIVRCRINPLRVASVACSYMAPLVSLKVFDSGRQQTDTKDQHRKYLRITPKKRISKDGCGLHFYSYIFFSLPWKETYKFNLFW